MKSEKLKFIEDRVKKGKINMEGNCGGGSVGCLPEQRMAKEMKKVKRGQNAYLAYRGGNRYLDP